MKRDTIESRKAPKPHSDHQGSQLINCILLPDLTLHLCCHLISRTMCFWVDFWIFCILYLYSLWTCQKSCLFYRLSIHSLHNATKNLNLCISNILIGTYSSHCICVYYNIHMCTYIRKCLYEAYIYKFCKNIYEKSYICEWFYVSI